MADSKTIQVTLKAVADIKDVQSNIQQIQKGLSGLQLPEALRTQFTKTFSTLEKNAEKASAALATGFKDKGSVTAYRKATDAIVADMQKVAELTGKIDTSKLTFEVGDANRVKALTAQIEQLKKDIDGINSRNLEAVAKVANDKITGASAWSKFFEAFQSGDIEEAEKALKRLQTQVANHADQVKAATDPKDTWYKYAEGVKTYEAALSVMKGETGEAAEKEKELATATQELEKIQIDANTAGQQSFKRLGEEITDVSTRTKEWASESQQSAESTNKLSSSLDSFKNKATYFFGLHNAVRMFQRAVRSAMETVKDLDKVMTETAVVTEFSVGDMWSQLPEYTERAKQLGVSIHDAYEAATLYYQQGLSTNEVMAVSNETLKMARIAGLDAADATDRMTNALRGFNMAITESNAQNINDVYSNLAAKTASNVDEISTAMTKVASLANNANMSFENTAAFLSQIIETTRESAETAGTALKTVIARFSEVKSLYSEGELLGTDTEGEEINVNKVSAALRTAGINLNEYLTGMKGLDDIFMELSEKWDSLDQVQQRYIATMAAGSRQQSRFIALMQDYGRMTQLVGEANNAAGASQQQFNKTLDSLQTKLNQLKDEWDTFLMGIANSDIIKKVIDFLTELVGVLNKVLAETNGLKKSFNSIGIVIATGLLGRGVTSLITKQVKSLFGLAGAEARKSFVNGFKDLKLKFDSIKPVEVSKETVSGVSELSKAYDNLMQASKTAADAKQQADSVIIQGTSSINKLRADAEAAAKAETVAELAYNKALQEQGISAALCNKIKEAGITDEEAAVIITKIRNGTLKEEDILNGKVTVSEAAHNKTIQDSNKDRIVSIGEIIASNAAKSKIPIINILAAKSEDVLGRSAAKTSAKLAISLGWISAIIIAVAALTLGVVLLVKALNSDTPEKRMKELKKATEEAETTAKETADAYNELKDSISSLEEKYAALDELTRGTQAWRDAVREINTEVLDLIDKYPELVKFMNNQGGVLKIDFDTPEVKDILSRESQRVTDAQTAAIGAKIAETNGSLDIQRDKYKNDLTNASGIAIDKEFDKLVKAFAKGDEKTARAIFEKTGSNKSFEEFWEDSGVIKALQGFSNELTIAESKLSGFGMELSAAAVSSMKFEEREGLSKETQQDFVAGYLDTRIQGIQEEIAGETSLKDLENDKDYEAFFRGIYGDNFKQISNNGQVDLNEGDSILATEAINRYAASKAVEQGIKDAEARMTELGAEGIDYMARFYTDKLKASEFDDSRNQVRYQMNDEEKRQFQQSQTAVASASRTLRNSDISNDQIFALKDLMNVDTYSKFSKDVAKFGTEGGHAYVDAYLEAIEKVPEKQRDGLANLLGGTDWSSMSDALGTMEQLQKIYGFTKEEAEEFFKVATSGAKTYITSAEEATQLQEKMKKSFDKVDELQERITKGEGTKEDVATLVEAGMDASMFEMTADGWKADTEAVKEYIKALKEAEIENLKLTAETNDKDFQEEMRKADFIQRSNGEVSLDYAHLMDENNGQRQYLIDNGFLAEEEANNREAIIQAFEEFKAAKASDREKIQQLLQAELDYERSQTYSVEENAGTGGSEKSVIMSAKREASELGLGEEEFEGYMKVIKQQAKDAGNELDDMHASLTALGATKTVKGLQGLVDTQKDWTKVVKKSSLETTAEIKVFNDFKKNVNLLVGSNEDLSDSFYKSEKNIALLKKAIKGDEEAIQKLRQAAAADIIINAKTDTSTAVLKEFADYVRDYKLPSLEVGVELDKSKYADFYDNCNAMAEKAGMTAKQVIEYFRAMGYDATVRVVKKKVTTMQGVISYDDSAQGWHEGQIPVKTEMEVPVVETLTSLGSKGGGVNFDEKNGGGGGGSDKTKHWENPYDELYNLQEKINEALRTRERLEREYQKLLKSETATNAQIRKDYFTQIASLREEIKLQEQLASGRLRQIKKLNKEMYEDDEGKRTSFEDLGVTKYANYNEKTGLITIDWEGLEKIEADPNRVKEGEAVEAYIGKLEELVESYEETRDAIWDMEDTIQELADEAIESYMNFEERAYDALVNYYEKQIDDFESLSNTIEDSTSKVLDGIQSQIEAERQMRENDKKEQEIEDKEARLAYLSRDTSGGNDLEILQLQKDIEDKRQSYEDTLIDQALEQMRDDADVAAEQRATQIKVMREQLKIARDYGELWPEVYALINGAVNEDGTLNMDSNLVKLLQNTEAFKSLSAFGQDEWIQTVVEDFHKAEEGLAAGGAKEAGDHQNTVNPKPTKPAKNNNDNTQPTQPAQPETPAPVTPKEPPKQEPKTNPYGAFSSTTGTYGNGSSGKGVKSLQWALKEMGYDIGSAGIDGKFGPSTAAALKKFQKDVGIAADGIAGNDTRNAMKLKGYKSGGLADFTGPAWLDGSHAKPEAILDASDTRNFISLRNILASLLGDQNAAPGTTGKGDNYFDIDITAEIGSDYDVDQLANRIKQQIQDDSMYRNVNAISFIR